MPRQPGSLDIVRGCRIVPCPYAERRGPVIYCRAAGKRVNPLSHPCLSKTRYTKCKYYRQAEEAKKRQAQKQESPPPAPKMEAPQEKPKPRIISIEPMPPARPEPPRPAERRPAAQPAQPGEPRTRGLTLDGRPARNCLECIYYGSRTRMCLLLGVEVKDPNDPPCAKS